MKIPTYENQIAPNAPTPKDNRLMAPPASAFPSSVHEAGARLGEVVTDIGSKLADHAIQFQKEQNEKTLFKLDTDYGAKIDAKLFDPKEGLIATRKLGKAAGVTADFNQFQKDTLAEIEALDAPDAVKSALGQRAMTRLENAKSAAVKYEAQQLDEDYKGKFNANIASQTRAMSYAPSAKSFLDGRTMLHATIEAEANRLQVGDEVKARMFAAADEDALKSYLGANLESNPKAALSALAPFKGSVSADAYAKLEGMAKNNIFVGTVLSSKMAGMGKDEIYAKYVAGEKDANRQAEMATVVNKAFAVTQPFIYRNLYRGVKNGTVKDTDLDAALNAGQITQSDWEGLWKATNDGRAGNGLTAEMKIALKNVELMVNDKYPSKQKRDEAMFVFEQKALAYPNPDVFAAEAKKSLDGVVVSTSIFHDSEEHGWEDELEAMRAESAERAAEINKAIAVLARTGKDMSPENVDLLINYWRTNPNDKRFQ